tara:strand:- start:71 stop:247 length:177 start_codon:yes stop_codon:yes gene_type:complete
LTFKLVTYGNFMNMKTVLKFDSGRKGFDKAIFILLILAVIIAVLGAFWIYPFFRLEAT